MTKDFYPFNHDGVVLTSLPNKVVLKTNMGHLCGYVSIPNKQIPKSWHGNYNAPGLQYLRIHGGITYAKAHDKESVFGFDCAHAGDELNPRLSDSEYVMKLVHDMEGLLLAFAKRYKEWKRAKPEKRATILDEINQLAGENTNQPGLGLMIQMLAGMPDLCEKKHKKKKREKRGKEGS